MGSASRFGTGSPIKEGSLPDFEQVPVEELIPKGSTWNTAETMRKYLGYIDQLRAAHVGKLKPAEGETILSVRRGLGAAAKSSGKELRIKQSDGCVYFWIETEGWPRPN